MRDLILVLATALLLRGCEAIDTPAAASSVFSKPLASAQGAWRGRRIDGEALLLFEAAGPRPLAALRCDRERRHIVVERMTIRPKSGVGTMTLTADNRTRTLPVLWDGASLPIAVVSLPLDDRMVAGLGRGIELELGGERTLVLPADRRIGELVEACRS